MLAPEGVVFDMRKRFLCIVICTALIALVSLMCLASDNGIYVNGEAFSGTLAQAIRNAGKGGTVGISGRVTTEPVGFLDGTLITDVTIEGITPDALLKLEPGFFDFNNSKYDVLTVKGSSVTIKNLTVDACFKVDFAVRVFSGASDIRLENVTARRGNRGAVNILSSDNITLEKVAANDSVQGGFYFDAVWDSSDIRFTDCTTKGNIRTGVLVRNGYGPVTKLDLSGITCYENTFAVEDRREGTLGGGECAEIEIIAFPKNSSGNTISVSSAKYYSVEKKYEHIRFGVSQLSTFACSSSIAASRYGFDTTVYYPLSSQAKADLREGETIKNASVFAALLEAIRLAFARISGI